MKKEEKVCPIAFYSRKISVSKINHEICDKVLFPIADSFKKWHHFLKGALHQVTIYIQITKNLNISYLLVF